MVSFELLQGFLFKTLNIRYRSEDTFSDTFKDCPVENINTHHIHGPNFDAQIHLIRAFLLPTFAQFKAI